MHSPCAQTGVYCQRMGIPCHQMVIYCAQTDVGRDGSVEQWLEHRAPKWEVLSLNPTAKLAHTLLFFFLLLSHKSITSPLLIKMLKAFIKVTDSYIPYYINSTILIHQEQISITSTLTNMKHLHTNC